MGRIRRVALLKGEISKAPVIPSGLPLPPAYRLGRALFAAAATAAEMPLLCHRNLTLWNRKSEYTLCKLSWPWYFITTIEQKLRQQRRSRVNKQGYASYPAICLRNVCTACTQNEASKVSLQRGHTRLSRFSDTPLGLSTGLDCGFLEVPVGGSVLTPAPFHSYEQSC